MKTEIIKNKESISDYVDSLDNAELVNLWNEYCRDCNYNDDEIYENDEDFFNIYFESDIMKAVRAISFGEYNYSDKYVKFNGYANLETFNDPETGGADKNTLIEAIFSEEFTPYDIELIEPEEEETE